MQIPDRAIELADVAHLGQHFVGGARWVITDPPDLKAPSVPGAARATTPFLV